MAYKARFLYLNDDGEYQEGMCNGVFITNVEPVDPLKVVNITWVSDVVNGSVVESIETDTEDLLVTVEWDGSAYSWNGVVSVNSTDITNTTEIDNTRRFTGSVQINLNGETRIIALHEDGAGYGVDVTLQGKGPSITDAQFVNGYPGTQTEVKEFDVVDLQVTFDQNEPEPTLIIINNFGACKSQSVDPTTTELDWTGGVYTATFQVTIDATGNTVTAQQAQVTSRNSFGTLGNTFESSNTIDCNDQHPVISFGAVTYDSGFDALKDAESGSIVFNYQYATSVAFTSPTNELSITNDTTLETPKIVSRIAGDYNVSTNNIRATAHRAENDSTTITNALVYIANVLPEIYVTEPYYRLKSGGHLGTVIQDYTITIASNQLLRSIPSLGVAGDNTGLLTAFTGGLPGDTFTATLSIHDDDTKGHHTWTNLDAENLSGMVQNAIYNIDPYDDEYIIGGFVERDVYFDPQAAEMSMGTHVVDTSKLVAYDKDLIPMEFRTDLNDYTRGFSITSPPGTYNPSGDILYWNDVTERENNTTGMSFIRIREDV